jgi:hypothetical protein
MFQKDRTDTGIEIGILKSRDILEVIYYSCDRDPIDLVADNFAIRTILIGLAAEHAHIVVSRAKGLRQAMRVGLHTSVGSGRIPVGDK